MRKSSATLILVSSRSSDSSRAMPSARATHERSRVSPSPPTVGVAIAGPSESFVRRGRNPEAATAWPFVPTTKGENDVVI
jgi:hypothetical protein